MRQRIRGRPRRNRSGEACPISDEVAFKMGPESEPGEEQASNPNDRRGLDVFVELKGGQCA